MALRERIRRLEIRRREAEPICRYIIYRDGETVDDARRRLGLEGYTGYIVAMPEPCESIEAWAAKYAPEKKQPNDEPTDR